MINVNLLPKNLRRSRGPDAWKIAAGSVAAIALLTMGILQYTVEGTLQRLNRDIAEAESEIAVLAPAVKERDELRARRTELQAVTSVAQTLEAGRTSWSADLAKFVQQLPSTDTPVVALNSLAMTKLAPGGPSSAGAQGPLYDGKAVTTEVRLNGRARSSDGLVRFVNAFETASDFGVQFQNASRDASTGEYTFAVTVGMIGDQPDAPQSGASTTNTTGSAPQANTSASTTNSGEAP